MNRALLALFPAFALVCACGKSGAAPDAKTTPAWTDASRPSDAGSLPETGPPEDPQTADLWARAVTGDDDELARLARHVGTEALIASTWLPSRRATALRALAFADDFVPLPFLAQAAGGPSEEDAALALDTLQALGSQPRRATDP